MNYKKKGLLPLPIVIYDVKRLKLNSFVSNKLVLFVQLSIFCNDLLYILKIFIVQNV